MIHGPILQITYFVNMEFYKLKNLSLRVQLHNMGMEKNYIYIYMSAINCEGEDCRKNIFLEEKHNFTSNIGNRNQRIC